MRKTLLAIATIALAAPALAQQSAAPTQPGQRMQTGVALGERSVREVMISQGGGGTPRLVQRGGGMYSVEYDR